MLEAGVYTRDKGRPSRLKKFEVQSALQPQIHKDTVLVEVTGNSSIKRLTFLSYERTIVYTCRNIQTHIYKSCGHAAVSEGQCKTLSQPTERARHLKHHKTSDPHPACKSSTSR